MNELHIRLSHIQKSYTRPVLTDINLEITQGSYITIVGASGSGKSTLLNILGLVEGADGGEFLFNGTKILGNRGYSQLRKENIGFLFQSYNLLPTLSCQENILLPTLYKKMDISRRFRQLVEVLDIGHLLHQRVNTLSGGEKQRVAFARSLILDPCLLLADEPTGNLDPKNRDVVLEVLRQENEIGRGIVLITHDGEVARAGKTVLTLKGGQLHEMEASDSTGTRHADGNP